MLETRFDWTRHPEASRFVTGQLVRMRRTNPDIATLDQRLQSTTGTKLFDYIDHLVVRDYPDAQAQLETIGFKRDPRLDGTTYRHPGAMLPRIRLTTTGTTGIAVAVDSVAHYLMVSNASRPIEGTPLARLRRATISTAGGVSLWIVERRTWAVMDPTDEEPGYERVSLEVLEAWRTRPRYSDDPERAIKELSGLARKLTTRAGVDRAAHLFFVAERERWLLRNSAARTLGHRLDAAGVGWASHDHHTFRSSRPLLNHLIGFFRILGFQTREQFYAGEEAGWGAQVVEQDKIGVALFLDVDLSPDEVHVDLTRTPLQPREELGTIGLWCALHGDSIFGAGLHHVAVRSVFDALTATLKEDGVTQMAPFSTLPYLRQAFTEGETWAVPKETLDALLAKGIITEAQAAGFAKEGARGSHLENIQRGDGFKGFSQSEVSTIIKATDPRA